MILITMIITMAAEEGQQAAEELLEALDLLLRDRLQRLPDARHGPVHQLGEPVPACIM